VGYTVKRWEVRQVKRQEVDLVMNKRNNLKRGSLHKFGIFILTLDGMFDATLRELVWGEMLMLTLARLRENHAVKCGIWFPTEHLLKN
jgi:hypothetical protein